MIRGGGAGGGDRGQGDPPITTYGKNPHIRTLNFEGQAAVGSYLMIMNLNIRLLGFIIGS